jgi:peptidoglycan hydrolase-like protein with peptidoglycan-binding domain
MLLKEGSAGADVGKLHQELIEAGIAIDSAETQAQKFGPTTKAAIVTFQAAHGLTADGICGDKTWAMLISGDTADGGPSPAGWVVGKVPAAVQPVIDQAISFVGTKEEPAGSNRGPLIDALNKAAGIPLGSPWCAAFATGMWHYCEQNPFEKSIGSAVGVQSWGKKKGCIVPNTGTALPGDIFVIVRGDGHGHVGLVVADLGDKVCTVEGNSGNAVKKLFRKKADLACFVRPLGLGLTV